MRRAIAVAVLGTLVLALPSVGRADSCGLPTEVIRNYSPSRQFEVIFEPRKEGERRPRMTIWQWREGKRVRACRRPMVNSETPRALYVTDSGHVVTFDDWCRSGYEHALVVYSHRCEIIRDADLEQLVPAERLDQTQRSKSSRHWIYYGEPILVGDSAVSFTSYWGLTATVSVRDGALSWSGPPFTNLARLVRGDPQFLVEAGFFPYGPGACIWKDEKVRCTTIVADEPKTYFAADVPRASLRGRLEPALNIQHLIRRFPSCGDSCEGRFRVELAFQEGHHTYRYTFEGAANAPPAEAGPLRALLDAFGFRSP